ncbi:MAG: zf-HC2 domain-containing protein [Acidimicrobiales bacterium]
MRLFRRSSSRRLGCAAVARRLQQYLDGELDEAPSAEITAHLQECLRCGLEADVYQHIKASLARRGPGRLDDPALARLHDFAEHLLAGEGAPS